jgi:serine/threonine-protein kinase
MSSNAKPRRALYAPTPNPSADASVPLASRVVATLSARDLTFVPAYMAPETIIANTSDERSAVYRAGVVAFETIAGRSPFAFVDACDAMRAHLERKPRQLGAPMQLRRAVARALAKSPAERWPTLEAFVEELARAAA